MLELIIISGLPIGDEVLTKRGNIERGRWQGAFSTLLTSFIILSQSPSIVAWSCLLLFHYSAEHNQLRSCSFHRNGSWTALCSFGILLLARFSPLGLSWRLAFAARYSLCHCNRLSRLCPNIRMYFASFRSRTWFYWLCYSWSHSVVRLRLNFRTSTYCLIV